MQRELVQEIEVEVGGAWPLIVAPRQSVGAG
jgi:hypothetical protein